MSKDSTYKSIINYLNKGVLESCIDYVKKHDSFVCLAKIGLKIDLDDAYTFKDLFGYLHSHTDFGPVLIGEEDAVILIFRDYKTHQAKASLQKIQRFVLDMLGIKLDVIGLTLVDMEDDLKSLIARLEKQYVSSKLSKEHKICYDTKYFNFNKNEDNLSTLKILFKKLNIIRIHNLYEGVPVADRVGIKAFDSGELIVKIEKNRIPFFMRESFCFIEHDLVPNIIKADIHRVNQTQNSLILNNLEFLDSSPVERSGIRVEPHRKIFASLTYEKKSICKGFIVNISENSVVLKLNKPQLSLLTKMDTYKKYLTLQFQIPTKKSYITTIKTKSTLFRTDNEYAIITIYPTPIAKAKIRSYISMQQANLLIDLKSKLKEASNFLN